MALLDIFSSARTKAVDKALEQVLDDPKNVTELARIIASGKTGTIRVMHDNGALSLRLDEKRGRLSDSDSQSGC